MKKLLLILSAALLIGSFYLSSCDKKNAFSDDKENPTINVTTPTADQVFNITDKIKLTGTITDNEALARAGWKIAGSQMEASLEVSGTSYTINEEFPISSVLPDGKYQLKVYAIDKAGNRGESSVSIEIKRANGNENDTEPPQINITKPAATGYEIAPGFKLPVMGKATDNVGIANVTLEAFDKNNNSLDRVAIEEKGKTVQISANLDITSLQDGATGTLKITAVDGAGNTTPLEIPFTVKNGGEQPTDDLTKPEVDIVSPKADGSTKISSGDKLPIDLNASDNVAVAKIAYQITPADNESVLLEGTLHEEEKANVAISTTVSAPSEVATYRLVIIVTDKSNNTTKKEVNFTVEQKDVTAPTVKITEPATDAKIDKGGSLKVKGEITDNVEVTKSSLEITGPDPATTSVKKIEDLGKGKAVAVDKTIDLSSLAAGKYTLTIAAEDAAGNANSGSVTFTIKEPATKPTITIVKPAENASVESGTDLDIEIKFSDAIGLKNGTVKILKGTEEKFKEEIASMSGKEHTYTKKLTLTGYDAAEYVIEVSCTNSSDLNDKTSRKITVTAPATPQDQEKPTINITAPAANAKISKATPDGLQVTGTLKDNVALKSAKITLTLSTETVAKKEVEVQDVSGTEKALNEKIAINDLANGTYNLKIVCTDSSDNAAETTISIEIKD